MVGGGEGDEVEAGWADWLMPLGDDIPLDLAAARLGAEECGADVATALGALDALAASIPRVEDPTEQMARLVQHLFGTLGFRGDTETYDDPRNSCIDQVATRGRGLPIALSVVLVEVGRRVGVPLLPIGFPGHFLVSTAPAAGSGVRVFLDPFAGGRIRPLPDLAGHLAGVLGRTPTRDELERALSESAVRDILVRMSTNLMRTWMGRGEPGHAERNASRRVALRPDLPSFRRDRGLLREQLGDREGAAMDLGAYLQATPDAPDAVRVRWQLAVLLRHG
ncbi:MAG: tetratricopeptide repeat protein [Myxococcota bacterium]